MEVKVYIVLFIVSFLIDFVLAVETTREIEGYTNGFVPVCPGVTKPAKIKERSLRYLSLIHLTPGSTLGTKQTSYNYFNMKSLAQKLDFSRKTAILMTGYIDSPKFHSILVPAVHSIYARRGYNILMVGFFRFVTTVYPKAARLIRPVGERTAEMIKNLTHYGLDPKKLHLVGVSLGGHGISYIGKHYRQLTGRNISRITAIDPAGPCFRRLGPGHRIDASDADKVDVMHTNNEGFGYAGAVGHVDFYVNGGEYQIASMAAFPCSMICSHIRSSMIWIASLIYPDKFIAMQCDSIQDARDRNCFNRPLVTNLLGPKTDFSKPGIYNVQTTNKFPYFLGDKGLSKDYNIIDELLLNMNKVDVLVV